MNYYTLAEIQTKLSELSQLAWKNPGFQWLGIALDELLKRIEFVLESLEDKDLGRTVCIHNNTDPLLCQECRR